MLHAKKTEPLLGGEWADKGSLDVPPPKQVDPSGFGLEDISMPEESTGPMFDIAGNVATLDSKTATPWTARHSASQRVEEYRNCCVETATSTAEETDSAMFQHPKRRGLEEAIRFCAAQHAMALVGLKGEGLGDTGISAWMFCVRKKAWRHSCGTFRWVACRAS